MLIAAAVPLIVRHMPGPKVPEVVLLLISGILIGPHVLGWASFEPSIDLISNVGLGMLFFLAGFELERAVVTGAQGKAAVVAWVISMCLSMAVVGVLAEVGFVRAFLPVANAPITTSSPSRLAPALCCGLRCRRAIARSSTNSTGSGTAFLSPPSSSSPA